MCFIPHIKVFIISIFTQIVFGRLTFLRENVNLPKKFWQISILIPPKTQIPVTKVFIFWHVKNKCNFCQMFFGRLTFSRKNGEIKDFKEFWKIKWKRVNFIIPLFYLLGLVNSVGSSSKNHAKTMLWMKVGDCPTFHVYPTWSMTNLVDFFLDLSLVVFFANGSLQSSYRSIRVHGLFFIWEGWNTIQGVSYKITVWIKNILKKPCLSCTDTETTLHVPAVPHGSHTGLEAEYINNKVWQHTGGTCVAPMLVPAWSPITASLFLLICSLEKLRSFLSAILGPGSEENIYCMTTWRR